MKHSSATKIACGVLAAALAAAAVPATGADGRATPTHAESKVLGQTPVTKFGRLSTLCLDSRGNLLVGDSRASTIKVFSPAGELTATWKLPLAPYAIHPCPDGTVYVGGIGKLARLDKDGNVLQVATAEKGNFPRGKVSGLTATDKDVFACFSKGWSLRSTGVLVRMGRKLDGAKTIVTGLRGCCQRLDIATAGGDVYVAENTRFRIVRYDREGKQLGKWGKRDRKGLEGFGACCNPLNVSFGPDGSLYTAESGIGRVKRYTADGKFLGLVGYVGIPRFQRAGRFAASCSNVALAVSADGKSVYVQDVKKNVVRVLTRKAGATTRPASGKAAPERAARRAD